MFRKTITLLAGLTLLSASALVAAAGYPDKPIKLIVPYAPGGTTDLVARIVASKLGEVLGQSVVVLNKPGAGGALGSSYAAKEAPDGYTLVMAVESSHAVNPNVRKESMYHPIKDFAPISNLANVLGVLDVSSSSEIKTFQELIAKLKAHPEKYSFGSSGGGGYSHLFGELFMSVTNTKLLHVPYKGLGPAVVDLMGGQIEVVFDNLPSSASLIQSGRIRPLAVAAPSRVKSLPNVPTYAEVGFPQLNTPSWFGLAAPAGVPEDILEKLNQSVKIVLSDPKVIVSIDQQGAAPAYTSRKEFADIIKHSNEVWKKVVEDIHFQKI